MHETGKLIRRTRCATRLWPVLIAVMLSGCDANPPPGDTGMLDVRSPEYTADGVRGCHLCHAGDFNRAIAATPHGDETNPATPYGQYGCESCHGPGSFHVSRAHGGKGVPKMTTFGFGPGASSREEQLAACQGCHHEQASPPAAIGFDGSAHDSPYVNCSTCHSMHVDVDPLSEPSGQAEICFACHRSQREGHRPMGGKPIDFSVRSCSRCHRIHRVRKAAGGPDAGG